MILQKQNLKTKATIKYKVGKSDSTPAYTFTVDIKMHPL
jgi:hypothetical protein